MHITINYYLVHIHEIHIHIQSVESIFGALFFTLKHFKNVEESI